MRVGRTPTEVAELAVSLLAPSRPAVRGRVAYPWGHGRSDLVRPRRAVARHRRRRGPAGGRRPGLHDRSRRRDRLRDRDRLPAAAQVDRRAPQRRARAGDRHQRLDAGRRVPVRRAGRARATRSSSSGPPTTARCCRCASAAPTCGWSSSSPTASTSPRSSACWPAGPARSSPTSSPTSRTRPATRCRRPSASGCSSSRASTASPIFEDDPYVALRFEGEPLPTMLSMDGDSVVYASSFSKTVCPGIRVGYLVGPAELIARIAKLATNTYISPSMVVAGDRLPVLPLGRARALDRDGQGGAARARRRPSAQALRARAPRRALRRAGGRLLPVGRAAARHRRRRAVRRRRRARRRVRQGQRLRARGRRVDAAAGLLRRHARSRSTRASTGSPTPTARRRPASRRSGSSALAPVALAAEHELLGQRDPRRRRGVGDHRDGLGDARP